jgi:ATP-dependent DNA helicase PIF1
MLLKNIDPNGGLVNGTRMKIHALYKKIIQCEILNGPKVGVITCIFPV